MILTFFVAAALQVQTPPPPTASRPRRQPPKTIVRDSSADSTGRRAPRRLAVTNDAIASAFKTPETRSLYEKARKARLAQDSAIRNYDAIARQRMSVNLGIAARGREHLMFREESAARIQWQHDVGAWVDLTGARVGIPVASKKDEIGALLGDLKNLTPIPYFPGYEALWIGGESSARAEVDDRDIVNPLAVGAEAYYRFAIADSVTIRLADGSSIRLREIEARPRTPQWNLALGSFWFDDDGRLVKCVYRMAIPMDMWTMAREQADSANDMPPKLVQGLVSPLRAEISAIAIEYSLMQGRFWLPSMRSMSGDALVMFARVPLNIEQRFEYRSVNGPDTLTKIDESKLPALTMAERIRDADDSTRSADSTRRAYLNSLPADRRQQARDSITRQRDSLRRKNSADYGRIEAARQKQIAAYTDSIERGLPAVGTALGAFRAGPCDSTGVRIEYMRRFAARMPVAVRIPCDLTKLINSPDLPKSIYDAGEEVFSSKDRDEMIGQALTLADQAPLALGHLPPPTFAFGLPMTRFNRVEGFSTGLTVEQQLGAGLSVTGTGRFGFGDNDPNVELAAKRSNLSKTVGFSVYHRLVAANDWGNPLNFGSSFSALMFGKDEGFYYKSTGADVSWAKGINSRVEWRLFTEKQTTAPVKSQMSLAHWSATDTFPANLIAEEGTWIGTSLHLVHNHGLDPRGFRTFTDVRLEAGQKDSAFGRAAIDLTMSKGLPVRTAGALTLSIGSSAGALPAQRFWYLGGTQTVRGQDPSVLQSGNAFWLARVEAARDNPYHRSILFGDLGWAGDRAALGHLNEIGRPLSGVGFGESMFDGMLRVDLSRGLYPKKQWRFDIYLEARF
jgi:hypothetical protein